MYISDFYETIFNHPKESVDKEIKTFSDRNGRENTNLQKCIVYAQDAPDKYTDGVASLSKKLSGVNDKLQVAKPAFETLLTELTELRQNSKNKSDPYHAERKEFLKEINKAKKDYDKEMKNREQELVTEYRLKLEETLRGVDPLH
ncbi:10451_t:CDS:2 [Funneliformis caledonium]|uniref:Biogenesis of lysosome-related organelles complex 1 subunit 5 n=1 Tax=Funneliformis caledonium TaxID=1117310 RepID=A0A9N9A1E0_9GLOM|nr:10451_t:CDS:2 [Funneliformis caledonium]